MTAPRIPLGITPTPLHRLDRLSEVLEIELWIKRDDLIGVGLGGNKVRKLEFLLADALAQGADVMLTTGGPQSNHALLTALCSAKIGLDCQLVLSASGARTGGNLAIAGLLGIEPVFVEGDLAAVMERLLAEAERLRQGGRTPYPIPVGGSTRIGSLGYVEAVREIVDQQTEAFDTVVCATGSGGTQAGLIVGSWRYSPATRVVGFDIGAGLDPAATVQRLTSDTRTLVGEDDPTARDFADNPLPDPIIWPAAGPGYARPSRAGVDAMQRMLASEGVVLDPVYSGKAFGGLLAAIDAGDIAAGERVLFLHTGGAGGLFGVGTAPQD